MNYYRELNEGLDKYIYRELNEQDPLVEEVIDEANPFKAVGKIARGEKTSRTYIIDGKEVSEKDFGKLLNFFKITLDASLQKDLQNGNELKVKDSSGNIHTLQKIIDTTTRADRKIVKKAEKNVADSGELSDAGKLTIKPIELTNGKIQYALYIKEKKITVYPSYKALEQAMNHLIDSFTEIKSAT